MAMSTVSWAPVVINPTVCTGCNECVKVCTNGVLLPNPEKGKPPIVAYPDECNCATSGMSLRWIAPCAMDCPLYQKGAIKVYIPYYLRQRTKRKK